MSKAFTVEVTIPELPEDKKKWSVGDTFAVEVEAPTPEKKARGILAGIALADMTDEQLKREIINANSVLYKAKQRGASEETIAANQARVDAAKAEKEKRQPVATPTEAPGVADALGKTDESGVYVEETEGTKVDEEAAAEI